jgi:hypothetical protein
MQMLPEFVRDEEEVGAPVKAAAPATLTGWELVVFHVVDEPEPGSDSAFATAAFAP